MGLERFRVKTPGLGALLARALLCTGGLFLSVSVCGAFNLDVENPAVYSGPNGSYFGYAVDFYLADSARHGQTSWRALCLLSSTSVSRPTVQPAGLLGCEEGLCADWAGSSSSSGFPVSPPHFPGRSDSQTWGHPPTLPLRCLFKRLLLLVFIPLPGK
ncbi:Integrin alpha-8 [Liparis tanakae]|uniref:Integrin alpha-8 n=1 Tax=Liparis tanakae TaxID=230148 RepID=A0A4Z2GWT7_9TELE|nr:Integrin alpha-8 [Liparis tanakae]